SPQIRGGAQLTPFQVLDRRSGRCLSLENNRRLEDDLVGTEADLDAQAIALADDAACCYASLAWVVSQPDFDAGPRLVVAHQHVPSSHGGVTGKVTDRLPRSRRRTG